MTKEQIARINELARKSKTQEGLTEVEKTEQRELRDLYRAGFRENFISQLSNTYVVDKNGNKTKVIKE